MHGDSHVAGYGNVIPARDEDFAEEYLSLDLAVAVVDSLDSALHPHVCSPFRKLLRSPASVDRVLTRMSNVSPFIGDTTGVAFVQESDVPRASLPGGHRAQPTRDESE